MYRILLVDDKPGLLDSLTFALTTLGPFTLETANDGIAGLEAAFTYQPDCMVIDVQMPGLNGYQLVKALRGDPATSGIPLIILTAFPQDATKFSALASGADQYLTKPTKPQILMDAILRSIALSREEREQNLLELLEQQV